MKIYTKTGDDGTTSLVGGERVNKDSLRVECYGTVDEVNSILGLIIAEIKTKDVCSLLNEIQNKLFTIGGELATPENKRDFNKIRLVNNDVLLLENSIDKYEKELEPLKQFILPSGTKGASLLHYARSVCRKTERLVISLSRKEIVSNLILIYFNRLSDLLFVLARYENSINQVDDIPWKK